MSKIKMTDKRREFVHAALDVLGSDTKIIDRTKIAEVLDAYDGLSFPAWVVSKELKTEVRGKYY